MNKVASLAEGEIKPSGGASPDNDTVNGLIHELSTRPVETLRRK